VRIQLVLNHLLAVAAVVGCHAAVDGPAPSAAPTAAGIAEPGAPVPVRAYEVELALQASQVSIAITNETGSRQMIHVGEFTGTCRAVPATIGATFEVACLDERGRGAHLKFVYRSPTLVVLRAPVDGRGEQLEHGVFQEIPIPADGRVTFVR
jgi:hypothetical protein